jgi:tetratricopeptide (TPR) repeat protein
MIEKTDFLADSGRLVLHSQQGKMVISKKLTDFIFLLLLIDPTDSLDRAQLVRFGSWVGNQPLSAGKQISRFIDVLEGRQLNVIVYQQKTNGWKLHPDWRAALPDAIKDIAKEHIGQRIDAIHLGTGLGIAQLLRWYRDNFEALVAMTTGQAQKGYGVLRTSMDGTSDETLLAISNLLATRIEQRLDSPRLPILPALKPFGDIFVRAVEIRRTAAYALHAKSDDWPELERHFKRQLAQLSGVGDFTSLAIIRNALSVLYRRMGNLDAAKEEIAQAAPLAVFSGDLILIQNVAFNLANIMSELDRAKPGSVPAEDYLSLLQFDASLRQDMSLGRDSAQTELLLAYLHYEKADYASAYAALDQAELIICDTRLPIDRALSLRIRGLLAAKESGNLDVAIDHLNSAEHIFRSEGYVAAANHVANECAQLI